jgi:hypothetical protein
MINGWISLRVEDPHAVGEWYQRLGLEIVGERSEIGSVVMGTKENGRMIVLLPGQPLGHPERLQMHLAVADVDAEYERLRQAGIEFKAPPQGMPGAVVWQLAYSLRDRRPYAYKPRPLEVALLMEPSCCGLRQGILQYRVEIGRSNEEEGLR